MNEQFQAPNHEQREHTPESAYAEALHAPEVVAHYRQQFKGIHQQLQLDHDDLSFPLSEEQVGQIIMCLQLALDRGQCEDTREAQSAWVHAQLRSLKPVSRTAH